MGCGPISTVSKVPKHPLLFAVAGSAQCFECHEWSQGILCLFPVSIVCLTESPLPPHTHTIHVYRLPVQCTSSSGPEPHSAAQKCAESLANREGKVMCLFTLGSH